MFDFMEVEILEQSKDLIELKVDSLTVAELLRFYLNEQGIKFAAWKREHPTKPVIFRIESASGGVKKAVSDAVKAIKKDASQIVSGLKK